MTKSFRITVTAVVVAAIVVGLVALNGRGRKDAVSSSRAPCGDLKPGSPETPLSVQVPGTPQAAAPVSTTSDVDEAPDLAEKAAQEPREKLIEEELAEAEVGVDPEEISYMTWVRVALREGNPCFAQELLRQMKELHSNSGLVTEAELLLMNNVK